MSELKLQQCRLDGRYDLRECLGRGSYAEIFVAEDVAATDGSPRTVVIKALNTYLQGEPDEELEHTLIENFRNEALALDRVRHPNVINRLGHGTAIDLQGRTFHYLVLEYLPGGDMQALCRRHPLTLERAVFYLEQIAAGLTHAHQHNVIHRDIKPSNLLLTADHETVKIADFGVAKIEADGNAAITRVGTDIYAAPEHHPLGQTGPLDATLLERPTLSPAADVYSLAKTAYMLLTGEAPRRFSQRPITALAEALEAKPWAPFVLRTLRRATHSNPAERYQSVSEFHEELRDALLPHTQILSDMNGAGILARSAETSETNRQQASAAQRHAPPPPSFVASRIEPTQAGAASSVPTRPRIVVPVAAPFEQAALPQPSRPARRAEEAPASRIPPSGATPDSYQKSAKNSPLSGRARRWLVALIIIALFAGMLLATHNYVRGLRNNTASNQARNNSSAPAVSPVGRDYVAKRNVNLRSAPNGGSTPIVGIVDKGSRVRVLGTSGGWFQVEVIERSLPKGDPAWLDTGWLDRDYVEPK